MNIMAKWLTMSLVGLFASQLSFCAQTHTSNIPNSSSVSVNATGVPDTKGKYAVATFAGGCFWCMQPPYDKTEGVIATFVGFTGGKEVNPTYKQVAYGKTTHAESIQVIYDPKKVTYKALLDIFWRNIDPMAVDRQFVDVGRHYRTSIFWHNAKQKELAEASKKALAQSGRFPKPIVTEIVKASAFYKAEEYHQKYYKKNPDNYHRYRRGSGRDQFLQKYWKTKK